MTMPANVILHIGAHKTATTHLQQALLAARPQLLEVGVNVLGPAQLRAKGKTLAERLALPFAGDDMHVTKGLTASISELTEGVERLVISEENFVGVLRRKNGQLNVPLYPKVVERISALGSVLAPDGLDVFLAIRAPAPFLNSVYSQVLMGGGLANPSDFRSKNPLGGVDWAGYVAQITKMTNLRSLIVWAYEDYEALFDRITALLVGAGSSELVKWSDKPSHSGLSARAVSEILGSGRTDRRAEFARLARQRFPVSNAFPKVDVFNGEDHAKSGLMYADQVTRIANMKKVILLRS